jgi:transposase
MRFYTEQHGHYCGIDLHKRTMYLCVLDATGEVVLERNVKSRPEQLLRTLERFGGDVVVGAECTFTWYWLADLCRDSGIPFVLGHALYMKAIHGAKTKNDRVDAHKIAKLLRGGLFPLAHVYPREMRPARDLLRRRIHLARRRAGLLNHIHTVAGQYNVDLVTKHGIANSHRRVEVLQHFHDPCTRRSVQLDIDLLDHTEKQLERLERDIRRFALNQDATTLRLLQTVPGIGKVLALVLLYEIGDPTRFERVQQFASHCRLVRPDRSSAGKRTDNKGRKVGNAYLKWAFSEAAVCFLRNNDQGKRYLKRLERRHPKSRALSILSHRLGRTVYYMLKNRTVFDMDRFVGAPVKK